MFDVVCSGCGKHQLLTSRRIRGLLPSPAGVVVAYECWCGHVGQWLATEERVPCPCTVQRHTGERHAAT
jgi:hypothetical protein